MKIKVLIFFLLFFSTKTFAQLVNFVEGWKFKTGDNLEWAKPDFDDSDWKPILTEINYESQGFDGYDGYSWYRLKFFLPSKVKDNAALKERVRLLLGKIDDVDQVFLNGIKIGQTGSFPDEKEGFRSENDVFRKYILSADAPVIRWNQDNVIAIRVFDKKGNGGLHGGQISIDMMNVMDYLSMDIHSEAWDMSRSDSIFKCIKLTNQYEKDIRVTLQTTHINEYGTRKASSVGYKLKGKETLSVWAKMPKFENAKVEFSMVEMKTMRTIVEKDVTPMVQLFPCFDGEEMYVAKVDTDFLYQIPISGERPIKVTAKSLPKGLVLDENTGKISGKISKKGECKLKLTVENKYGIDKTVLKIKVSAL